MLLKELPYYCNAHMCSVDCEYTKECDKEFNTLLAPAFFKKFLDKMYLDIKKDSEIEKEESK